MSPEGGATPNLGEKLFRPETIISMLPFQLSSCAEINIY
ncbi:hypothetical protein CEV33_4313 [Brucella grignonensis]|uniref:Uncharacterized protein n=1 Tax=Brucella grignonensis TaxID=94627 RepID=A0A256FN62_9HYPH|nr:hypothetical protein CEV33_4313 [Brucella grignonensis]